MLSYPGHLLTQTEVSLRKSDVRPLLRKAARLFSSADSQGRECLTGGGDPSLSDVLIHALLNMDLRPEEARALLHVLGEARDVVFELQARREAFGMD